MTQKDVQHSLHIAFICDGNGRWATSRGLSRTQGHLEGLLHTLRVIHWCLDRGIRYASAFLLSTENWRRSESEVSGILNAVVAYGPYFASEMHQLGVRLIHAGSRLGLSADVLQVIDHALSLTSNNQTAMLALAFNYGGRLDIVHALNRVLSKDPHVHIIDEHVIEQNLMTAPLPPVDLLVRTGKESRLSNFMLWQCSNAILCFPDCYWPDFTEAHLDEAIRQLSSAQLLEFHP